MTQLSETDIKEIAEKVLQKLGENASKKNIESVVTETISRIEKKDDTQPKQSAPISKKLTDRVIVTAFGQNKKGILAGLTGAIAGLGMFRLERSFAGFCRSFSLLCCLSI